MLFRKLRFVGFMAIVAMTAMLLSACRPAEQPKPAGQPKPQAPTVQEADVVIVGGGGAGLAAAVTAADEGAKVILIEKMPMLGGNTIRAGGAYNAVDPERQKKQNIEDSIEKHYQQTLDAGDRKGNPELVRILVENALDGLHWLESLGMKFKPEVYTVLGGLWPRAHSPVDPAGTGYISTLKKAAEAGGVKILLETRGKELQVENGRVVGVVAVDASGKEQIFRARRGVILATGGFGANPEMRQKYNPSLGPNIPTTNHPGATGDGIVMAEKVGANLVGMEYIQLLPTCDPENGALTGWVPGSAEQMVFVNKEGKRFVAEDERRDVMTQALFKQPDALMYVIVDSAAVPKDGVTSFGEKVDDLVAKGKVFKANSIEELANKIGVPAKNLVETIKKYNAGVDKKKDEFGKKLLAKIEKPPFYASPRKPAVHHTMGGVQIDTKARVIGKDGKPIPGLYAAGEVTGGIHGTNRVGGNALADVIVFGRIAGKSAARGE